jgi:hypothetical protein
VFCASSGCWKSRAWRPRYSRTRRAGRTPGCCCACCRCRGGGGSGCGGGGGGGWQGQGEDGALGCWPAGASNRHVCGESGGVGAGRRSHPRRALQPSPASTDLSPGDQQLHGRSEARVSSSSLLSTWCTHLGAQLPHTPPLSSGAQKLALWLPSRPTGRSNRQLREQTCARHVSVGNTRLTPLRRHAMSTREHSK